MAASGVKGAGRANLNTRLTEGQVEYERGMGPPVKTLYRRPTEHPSDASVLMKLVSSRRPQRPWPARVIHEH
jgi:hypothetical protein